MAVPVVQTTTEATSTGESVTLTKPTGVAVGDLLIVLVANEDSTSQQQYDAAPHAPTPIGDWTLIGVSGDATADAHIAAWFKIADGNEAASTTISMASPSDEQQGWYIRVSGANAGAVHQVNASQTFGAATSFAVAGVTTTVDNCLVFYALATDGADTLPHSVSGTGWTESDEQGSTGGAAGVAASWGTRSLATQGASGTATVTTSVSDGAAALQFAFQEYIEPLTIRATLHDVTDTVYADATVVYCFLAATGALEYTGAVGEIAGFYAGTPSGIAAAASGEAVFTFPPGDTAARFLSVKPSVDANGLVTNNITPGADP